MSKKTSRGDPSKNSSNTTVSFATQSSQRSSIAKSAFAPTRLQLALFASVIQGLESQNLRIHDTRSGRLRCEHVARPGTTITSLDWGYYAITHQEQQGKKKRKREQSKTENVVVAYGTSTSEICMFSPAEARVIGKLSGAHERGIRDFRFSTNDQKEAWSIGGDGKLVQWNLPSGQATRTIPLPDPAIACLSKPSLNRPQVLCASSTPFTIDIGSADDFRIESYDAFKNPIHSLFRSELENSQTESFLAADSGRYINIYHVAQKRLVCNLIAGGDVSGADFYCPDSETKKSQPQQMLAVTTKDGNVELFFEPFLQSKAVNGDLKSKSKALTRKASALVKLVHQDSTSKTVPVVNASLQGPELIVATVQGGVELSFQKIRWQDELTGDLLFEGVKQVPVKKAVSTLNTVTTNGVKDTARSKVDESRTVVIDGGAGGSSQAAAITISSSEDEAEKPVEEDSAQESDDEDDSEEEAEPDRHDEESESTDESDEEMEDVADDTGAPVTEGGAEADGESEADAEPTFGELLASKTKGVISIADGLLPDPSTGVTEGDKALAMHSGISLATVLTQSLRTNDTNLLESCFHATDTDIIKSTIQRLDSSLAGILLSKLAERLASRPGRYGHLLTWVQWTCVVHGGAVAGRLDVVSKIRTLYKVLTQRSNSLEPLLLLKGKLDMLDAQLTLRKDIQAQQQLHHPQAGPRVINIDEHDNWSSDEAEDEVLDVKRKGKQPHKTLDDLVSDSVSDEEDEEDEEDMPMTNGISHSDLEDEEEDSDEEIESHRHRGDGLVDDEAEVSDEDSHPSDEEEEDSDEEEGSDDDEEDSEMADFVNDDSPSIADDADNVDTPDDDTPEKPPVKKAKRA